MLKVLLWTVLSVLIVTGCAAPKYNYMPDTIAVSEPPLGSTNTREVGAMLLRQGRYIEHDAIYLPSPVKISWAYTLHTGYYQKQGEDENAEFYRPGGGVEAGHIQKAALADAWKSVMVRKEDDALCIVTVVNAYGCTDSAFFERTRQTVQTRDSFQQTLIYNGRIGNKINIGYREFAGDMARPAFSNSVEYDLSESATIGYQGALLEVLEATNRDITYRVISNFRPTSF